MSDITVEIIGGVQVSVETGTALVLGTEAKNRNVEVKLSDPTRSTLKFDLKGWVDKANAEAIALAERVTGTTEMVSYRIEVHRAKHVDPNLPIAEVPATPNDRHRRLVSLVPATSTADTGNTGNTAQLRGNGSGARVQEAKPWEATNSDGSPNLGSYEVLAAVGMTELAHELMLARAVEAGHDVFSLETMRRLARTFLLAADRVQAAVRADGHADRMDNSHARARGAVRAALAAYPVPWEAGADEKAAWVEDLVAWATDILRCALELAQAPPLRDMSRTQPAPAAPATVGTSAEEDPFRPFDESNELLAGPSWARKFAVAMTASGHGPKVQAAVIHYATGGTTRHPAAVRRTQTELVAATHARLDRGELVMGSDGVLVDVKTQGGAAA